MAKKIGFIGLGTMGQPMAKNLLKAGFPIVGYDINKDSVKDVEKAGGKSASSPKDVADQSDIIITMLPDSPDVEDVYLGSGDIIAARLGNSEATVKIFRKKDNKTYLEPANKNFSPINKEFTVIGKVIAIVRKT